MSRIQTIDSQSDIVEFSDTAVEQFDVVQTEEEIWLKRCCIRIQQCNVSASTKTPQVPSTKSKDDRKILEWRNSSKFFKNSNKNVEKSRTDMGLYDIQVEIIPLNE
ncbi:hypothetical protein AVEN_142470-1 [Araneus ventricosus]|uniref:Uncharacterized protein n=1 Tax=Araneus ventricosus TaxID=182803 RepID=A0A4Y2DSG9_ARAVE|nr:hypothetical protein AVEN_142470-1 [Araneus ventricosus]